MDSKIRNFAAAIAAMPLFVGMAAPASAQQTIEEQVSKRIKRGDTDGNGTLSFEEFKGQRLKDARNNPQWGPEMTDPEQIKRGFRQFDKDGNGEIDQAEMVAVLKAREAK